MPHQAARRQSLRRNDFTFREGVEHLDVQHREFLGERIVEPALGNPAVQRHLPALETRPARKTFPRFLALIAGSRGFRKLRPNAAPDTHFPVARAALRTQVRQINRHVLLDLSCWPSLWQPGPDLLIPPNGGPYAPCRVPTG